MPYLYCEQHGREHETDIIEQQDAYRQADEIVLVAAGTLVTGPWQCDSCNAQLRSGDTAMLVSAFPSHCRDELYDYDFGYEQQYFAMSKGGTATAYGAEWPDDSIRNRRKGILSDVRPPQKAICALDVPRRLSGDGSR